MNKLIGALALSFIITGSQFAARSDFFRPYRTEISNKSGGLALVQKTNGISGLSRKTEMENNTSVTVMVKKLGAELKVMAGPEGNKTMREVEFFCKEPNVFTAQVILNPKGVTTNGFYTENKPYDVRVINESGGNLVVLDAGVVTGLDRKQVLPDGKASMLTVRPGSFIVVHSGPENKKMNYRINFAEQTGANPTVIFKNRGFANRGVEHKNVEIRTQRVYVFRGLHRPHARAAAETVVMKKATRAKRERSRRDVANGRSAYAA
jgi:hypothetical protein